MNYVVRVFICIITFGLSLYVYIDKLNAQTELKIKIPALVKEIEQVEQVNIRYAYQIECFKNPAHLLELAKQSEFAHLRFPYAEDVLPVPTGFAQNFNFSEEEDLSFVSQGFKLPILLGSKR